MATLDQLKALFPDAASDSDVIKKAAAEFGISPADIASEVGVKISSPGMWTSVKRGVGQVESALGSTARDLGLERAGRALEAYGEDVAFRNPSGINTVGEAISSPWLTTKEALGELAPQLGASVATGIGGRVVGGVLGLPFGPAGVAIGQNIGAGAGAYLGNLAQEYGGIRSEQREKGIEDKTRALGAGATAAALDTALGAERLVNKIGNKGLNILSREAGEKLPTHVLKQAGLGAVGEAGTEAVQTALERFGAYKELTGAEAFNEYGLAAIKGGLGGGIVRGGLSAVAGQRENTSLIPDTNQGAAPTAQGAPANDISQAFQANDRTTPDSIMSGLMGRAADPLAGRSSLYGQQAPAVVGGTTDIAQAQQQAQAESQQIQAAQAQQAAREQIYTEYGIADPQNPTKGNLFGKPLFGRNVPAVADAIATATQTMTPYQLELAQAVNKANAETGGKLLNFQFNANDPAKSVQKAFEAVGKVAVGFQIADVQSAQEAAQILDEQSKNLSGTKLEQLNAIHFALTGEDTSGFIAAQQSKAEKGAKDGKLQLQTTTGLGTVPVEGGAGEANAGGAGLVRPTQVQPIGAAGLGEGSLGLQTGQPPTGGVRAGTGADTGIGDGQPIGSGQGQGQVSGQAQAAVSGAPQVTTERQTDENLGTVPTVQQEQAIEEQQVEGVPGLIRNALRMIYKSDRKVDLLLRLTEKTQRGDYATLAKEYDVTEQYVKELASDAITDEGQQFPRFIMKNIDKFMAAVNTQAEQSGISVLEALDALQVIHDAYEGGEAAQLGTEVNETDISAAGLAIQNREERTDKTGKGTGKSDLTNVTNIVDETDYRDRASQAYLEEMDAFDKDPSEKNRALLDAVTAAASAKNNGQAKTLYQKYQVLKGTRNAVQEQSTDEGNVREPAGGGEAVGEGNAKPQKPARKAKQTKAVVKPTETPPQVTTPEEQWLALAEQFPAMPPYESLTPDEKTRWDDLAGRGVANLAAANRLLEGAVTTRATEAPSAAGAAAPVNAKSVLDTSKYVYHAVRSDASLASIMRTGVMPGTNVSTTHNGQAFAGEGDTILVLPKMEANVAAKGYQADSVVGKRVFPVAILKDLSLAPTQDQDSALDELGQQYEKVAEKLSAFDKTLGITESQRVSLVVRNSAETKKTFGDFYDRIMELSRSEDRIFREMDRAEQLPETATPVSETLSQYGQYGVPVFALDIEYDDSTNNTKLKATPALTDESRTIDGDGLVREITPEQQQLLAAPVSKLTEGQTVRLEKHYGAKRGTSEFLTKLHDDIALYAAKGAAAVQAAVRDIIKAVYTAVLAAAVVFNPTYMSKAEAYVISPSEEYSVTTEVRAEAPAAAAAKMSDAAKRAYATLMPALKAELTAKDKLLIMADKPSGRIFVFTPDGKLVLEKKSLFGLAKGDFYKGNNDLPSNRITPAGLHNIVMVDAAKGGGAAKTAGEYDFGKVFGIVDENPGVLTIMHSVWMKEADAPKRAAALKSESAADSRYSFGCINVDKDTYKSLLDNYGAQMDGAKLFIVPDNQERVMDFVTGAVAQNKTGEDNLIRQSVQPVTETRTGTTKNATETAGVERTIVGKEEETRLASKSKSFFDANELADDFDGVNAAIIQLDDMGIGHAMDYVSDWETINDPSEDAINGEIISRGGRYKVVLNEAKLTSSDHATETVTHEVGHAIDMAPHGGIYSSQPEMSVVVKDGKITPVGAVAREMHNLYKTDAGWAEYLEYPFDTAKFKDLDNHVVIEGELFAQVFSVYVNPRGRAKLEKIAPQTAAFMAEVIKHVQSTRSLQVQTAPTQAARSLAFRNRNTGAGGQTRVNPLQRREETERLASRSAPSRQGLDLSQPVGMFEKAGSWLDTMLTNPKQALKEVKLGFLTLEQIADLDKSPTQVVRAYADAATAMQMTSKRLVEKAAQIDQLWAKLDANTSKQLSDVMRSATRMSFDPDKMDEFNENVDAGKDTVTPEKLALSGAYEVLPEPAKKVYRRVRDHFAESFEMRKAIMEEVGAKLGGKELKEIQDMYAKVKGPYFPLGRTGDYYAVGMSPRVAELMDKKDAGTITRKEAAELSRLRKQKDQYQASAHNTLYEAKKAAEAMERQLGTSYFNKKSERLNAEVSKMPNFSKMEEYINTQLGGDTRTEVRSMLTQMMFDTLPEHHALKNQMKREGIYGENEDMRQVFAQTSISQAHYISRLQHSEKLNQAMLALARQSRRDLDMRSIENELKLRNKLNMENSNSPMADAMVNASYFAHLGLSPAFLLTNLTQVPMITAPWLGARHGVGATKRAMAAALGDAAKMIKTTYADGDWRSELNWNSLFPKGSNEDRMFRDLLDRNVLDITMEHDLAAIASANRGFFDDNIAKASKGKLQGMSDVIRMVNTPVRITELANRAVTALSAYRLKMAALASNTAMTPDQRHEAAVNYAARAVSETQLNYSELNAPRHMRQVFGSKTIAKMVFQFRKYQQGMLYLVAKNIADSLPGSKASDEDRRIARRTIAGLYITTGLMAGTTGMPLMGTVGLAGIANLLASAFGEDDEPWDFETEYRNFLTDWFGRDVALLIAKGLPAYLGADLSQRVGMAELANPIPFVQRGTTGASTVANVLYAAGGAPVGMIGTMYDGLVAMANGDVAKGVEKVIPVKMVKDALRAYRYADEGLTDRRGNVVLPPEKFDTIDLALRGMGFTPTIEAEYYAANEAVQSAKTAATDVRTRLIRQYAEAKMRGEPVADVREEIAGFNSRHPQQGIRITESTLLKAIAARRQMAAQRTESGVRISKADKPFASAARFAEAE